MKRKTNVLFLAVLLCISIFSTSWATSGIITEKIQPDISDDNIKDMTSTVLAYIKYAGLAIAVGMTIYVGIKYMMSAANERASLKGRND